MTKPSCVFQKAAANRVRMLAEMDNTLKELVDCGVCVKLLRMLKPDVDAGRSRTDVQLVSMTECEQEGMLPTCLRSCSFTAGVHGCIADKSCHLKCSCVSVCTCYASMLSSIQMHDHASTRRQIEACPV